MILWIIAIGMTLLMLTLLVLLFLRKVQFDAIHHNFLDLEDELGGKVIRHGFASRPRFTGTYKGQDFSINITSEKEGKERRYYIGVTMEVEASTKFTVMAADWLNRKDDSSNQRKLTPLLDGKYMLEAAKPAKVYGMNLHRIEKGLAATDPFAYVLVTNHSMLLERITTNLIEDTRITPIRSLLDGMNELRLAVA